MIAVPIKNIDVIPMTKYEYKNKLKKVSHLEYKWIKGFYFTDIHIWLSEDNFYKYFKLNEN